MLFSLLADLCVDKEGCREIDSHIGGGERERLVTTQLLVVVDQMHGQLLIYRGTWLFTGVVYYGTQCVYVVG